MKINDEALIAYIIKKKLTADGVGLHSHKDLMKDIMNGKIQ